MDLAADETDAHTDGCAVVVRKDGLRRGWGRRLDHQSHGTAGCQIVIQRLGAVDKEHGCRPVECRGVAGLADVTATRAGQSRNAGIETRRAERDCAAIRTSRVDVRHEAGNCCPEPLDRSAVDRDCGGNRFDGLFELQIPAWCCIAHAGNLGAACCIRQDAQVVHVAHIAHPDEGRPTGRGHCGAVGDCKDFIPGHVLVVDPRLLEVGGTQHFVVERDIIHCALVTRPSRVSGHILSDKKRPCRRFGECNARGKILDGPARSATASYHGLDCGTVIAYADVLPGIWDTGDRAVQPTCIRCELVFIEINCQRTDTNAFCKKCICTAGGVEPATERELALRWIEVLHCCAEKEPFTGARHGQRRTASNVCDSGCRCSG